MSSRILPPGDDSPVEAVVWRQVGSAGQSQWNLAALPGDASAQLREQCEQRVREARSAGLREGEAAGRSQAAADLHPVIERLTRSIAELGGLRARLRKEAEGDVIKLSLAIARRVLRRELAVDPDALHGLVVAAFEKLQGQESCRVRVHPSQAAAIQGCLAKVSGASIEVIPDPSREPGGVIFETRRGNLDASVDTQLQEIERGLTDLLHRAT